MARRQLLFALFLLITSGLVYQEHDKIYKKSGDDASWGHSRIGVHGSSTFFLRKPDLHTQPGSHFSPEPQS
ncbi:unnamed protein product [Pieris macdunnoughi]|uniref:Uncharacterized protein n=1 Tax=Pieris macdunnoughi TaxID=345717 RepID=A0A821LQU9_9NEOP|nr:unnamed protein product [Pieris macdunnoughi]